MRIPKTWSVKTMKVDRCRLIVLLACFIFLSVMGISAKENVVSFPYGDNIPSFVPYYWQSQHMLAQGTIFEGLFGYVPDAAGFGGVKVEKAIAEDYSISKDGKVWTIKVRKDKKWSNGDPINARDFEWTYKYMCDPSIPDVPLWANHLQYLYNGWKVKAGGAPIDELGVKCTDDYTIVFTLAEPRFDFNCWLVVAGAMPLHRKTVEKFGPNEWWKPGNIVCNGPYIPTAWTANKDAVLMKNKNYVGQCGNVDKIILKNFPIGTGHIQAFQAGEVDAAFITAVADYKYATKDKKLKEFFREEPNDLQWSGYQFSRCFTSDLYNNKKLRQAFAMSIDRKTLCNTVLEGRATATSTVWPPTNVIGKNLKGPDFNAAAAKKLLAEAGYPDGKGLPQLTFYITGSMPEVEFVVDQWKKNLGVNVKIESLEGGVYWNQYVWQNYTPDAKPGFVRINAPMNSLEGSSLDKGLSHNLWVYDFDVAARKKWYEIEEARIKFLTTEGGLTEADWKPLTAKKDALLKVRNEIIVKETNAIWKAEMTRKPTFDEQYLELYDNWKKATTNKDKTEQWRLANRLLLEEEKSQTEYNGMNESNRQARRLRYDMLNLPFEKAVEVAAADLQIMADQYYMVPLYFDKAQYLLRKNITGFMLYKFAWGPNYAFNYKYLNVK